MRVISGEVLIHSNSRDEVYKSLYLGKGRNVAIECFAKVPEDLAFIV
jgi:hypothetical protein